MSKLNEISYTLGVLVESVSGLREDIARHLAAQGEIDERVKTLENNKTESGGFKAGAIWIIGGLCGFISLAATVFSVILPFIVKQ